MSRDTRWRWRKRANDFDLSLFRESAREVVAAVGAGMVAVARKALEAMESELPEMKPRDWGEALDAYRELRSLLPMETIVAFANEAGGMKPEGKDGEADIIDGRSQELDADGYMKDLPEVDLGPVPPETPEQHLARTGFYPRETWVDPEKPPPPG